MLDPEFVQLARCLHTRSPLRLVEPEVLERLNRAIAAGSLKNGLGEPLTRPLDAALINEAEEFTYPVIDGIPILLIDEAIDMRQLSGPTGTESGGINRE